MHGSVRPQSTSHTKNKLPSAAQYFWALLGTFRVQCSSTQIQEIQGLESQLQPRSTQCFLAMRKIGPQSHRLSRLSTFGRRGSLRFAISACSVVGAQLNLGRIKALHFASQNWRCWVQGPDKVMPKSLLSLAPLVNATKKSCLSHAFWPSPIVNASVKIALSKSEPFTFASFFPPCLKYSHFLKKRNDFVFWLYGAKVLWWVPDFFRKLDDTGLDGYFEKLQVWTHSHVTEKVTSSWSCSSFPEKNGYTKERRNFGEAVALQNIY